MGVTRSYRWMTMDPQDANPEGMIIMNNLEPEDGHVRAPGIDENQDDLMFAIGAPAIKKAKKNASVEKDHSQPFIPEATTEAFRWMNLNNNLARREGAAIMNNIRAIFVYVQKMIYKRRLTLASQVRNYGKGSSRVNLSEANFGDMPPQSAIKKRPRAREKLVRTITMTWMAPHYWKTVLMCWR